MLMRILITLFFCASAFYSWSQNMTNERLGQIIAKQADSVAGGNGQWQFIYKEAQMLCVTDARANRMRIISPITQADLLTKDLMLDALTANFHTALDVRYAISQGLVWSAFIHPLQELSDHEVEEALNQVYLAAATFGTTFSSTPMVFGAGTIPDEEEEKEAPVNKL